MLTFAHRPVQFIQDSAVLVLQYDLVAAYYLIAFHTVLRQIMHQIHQILWQKLFWERFLRLGHVVLDGHYVAAAAVMNLSYMRYE